MSEDLTQKEIVPPVVPTASIKVSPAETSPYSFTPSKAINFDVLYAKGPLVVR